MVPTNTFGRLAKRVWPAAAYARFRHLGDDGASIGGRGWGLMCEISDGGYGVNGGRFARQLFDDACDMHPLITAATDTVWILVGAVDQTLRLSIIIIFCFFPSLFISMFYYMIIYTYIMFILHGVIHQECSPQNSSFNNEFIQILMFGIFENTHNILINHIVLKFLNFFFTT